MVPVSSSRPAILGAPILLGAVFTFSAGCAVAAIDPTPRKALQCERHEGVFTMTLAHGTDRLGSARLVLRRIAPDDLPFFTRIHALPEVAQYLYPGGRPRSPEESAAWLQATLESDEQLALGSLAVLRKEDGALIGRCGLMDLVVASAAPEHGMRRGWFGRAQAPAGGYGRSIDVPDRRRSSVRRPSHQFLGEGWVNERGERLRRPLTPRRQWLQGLDLNQRPLMG